MSTKTTQIRITNKNKEKALVNFKDIVDNKTLLNGLMYDFEGKDNNGMYRNEKAYFARITSSGVLKSINRMVYPDIELKDYKQKNDALVDVRMDVEIKDVKIIINPINHIVITFFHK